MATDLVEHDGGRRRAGRSEPQHFGTVEADDQATGEGLAAEKWPGKRLIVQRQPTDLWNQVARVPPPKKRAGSLSSSLSRRHRPRGAQGSCR